MIMPCFAISHVIVCIVDGYEAMNKTQHLCNRFLIVNHVYYFILYSTSYRTTYMGL